HELFLHDLRHEQVAAQIKYADLPQRIAGDIGGAELAVGAEGMNEPAILTRHVDDERLARVGARRGLHEGHIDPGPLQHVGDDAPEDVVADASDYGSRHAHLDEIDGRVGGAPADG